MSNFRKWLYDNGYLIKDFSKTIEVHRSSLHRWMKGEFRPGAKAMFRIKQITKGRFTEPVDLVDP